MGVGNHPETVPQFVMTVRPEVGERIGSPLLRAPLRGVMRTRSFYHVLPLGEMENRSNLQLWSYVSYVTMYISII